MHPSACCKYSLFSVNREAYDTCQENVCNTKETEAEQHVCTTECLFGDLFVDGTVNTDKIRIFYFASKTDQELSEEAVSLLESSFEKASADCKEFFELLPMLLTFSLTDPMKESCDLDCYSEFFSLVAGIYFVNCTAMEKTTVCQNMKSDVEKCVGNKQVANMYRAFSKELIDYVDMQLLNKCLSFTNFC